MVWCRISGRRGRLVEYRRMLAWATGLRSLPCHRFDANAAWLEIILAATDLVAWSKLIGFTGHPDLATCEIATFRYRVLHVAARITRGARQIRLRIDATWRWATAISRAWQQLHSGKPHLTARPPPTPTRKARPWNARTPSDTGRLAIPIRHNQPHKLARTDFTRPRTKN
jgi:hypothetical protein